MGTNALHTIENPILMDEIGYLYYQEDLINEGGRYLIKSMEEYQREQQFAH